MTHAQAVLYVMPVSLLLITWALLKALELMMPLKPQPVYFSNGTVDRMVQAIKATVGHEQIGLVDAEGYVVIRGERFMLKMEGYEESTINIVRQRGQQ